MTSTPEISPVESVINKIAEAVHGGTGHKFLVYPDCDNTKLEKLAQYVIECLGKPVSDKIPIALLLRTPFVKPYFLPWVKLLESILLDTGLGMSCDLDEVVNSIIGKKWPNYVSAKLMKFDEKNFEIAHGLLPSDQKKLDSAKNALALWARLEQLAGKGYNPIFSAISGGLRPLIYVFDDYNNYITQDDNCFKPKSSISKDIKRVYEGKLPAHRSETLEGILEGYCGNLNNIQLLGEVIAPKLWISGGDDPCYQQVAQALPFDELDRQRERIGAFLVDLEWLPTIGKSKDGVAWSKMGYRAIRMLSLRYPEIPCFVMTGERSMTKLQEALTHGASWCYKKAASHHGYEGDESQWLTVIEMALGLHRAASVRYGAFSELPYADQLKMSPEHKASKKLGDTLKIEWPLGRCNTGKTLQRLIARIFPDGECISPNKIMSGKSKAKATFFVEVTRSGVKKATRFLKVGGWIAMQKEYAAYQRAICPVLGSHVAHIVSDPVIAEDGGVGMHWGALVYSTAGLPSAHNELRSLEELLADDKISTLVTDNCIEHTLCRVLKNLHGSDADGRDRRPLSAWLGWVLPPLFTGELIPLEENQDAELELSSWGKRGFKQDAGWIYAAHELRAQSDHCKLTGFYLDDVEWNESLDSGQLTIVHPNLGFRVRLRGSGAEIRRRFGALWVRPGMTVSVVAKLDSRNDNKEYKKIQEKVCNASISVMRAEKSESVQKAMLAMFFEAAGSGECVDPFEIFQNGGLPDYFLVEARAGAIHGDLNLNNILFAAKEQVGWLIDFEYSSADGMIAFDMAKMEAEIWNHLIFPELEELSKSLPLQIFDLLAAALIGADNQQNSVEVFAARLKITRMELLFRMDKLLKAVARIRNYGKTIKLSEQEMSWARAAYFMVSSKHLDGDRPALSYLASAWNLSSVAPKEVKVEAIIKNLKDPGFIKTLDEQEIAGLLIAINQKEKIGGELLNRLTCCMGSGNPIPWPKGVTERWDFASTGSVANITPIFGYLWLMAKAHANYKQANAFTMVVPKISSKGASCGTVDILEAGGLAFPSDPDEIIRRCQAEGGVLCQQDDALTPVDKELMKRRKETNTMKSAALVYASIIGKKIAMGCTHVVVDVKVGKDTKMFAPWMTKDMPRFFWDASNKSLVVEDCNVLLELLRALGLTATVKTNSGVTWVEQACDDLAPIKNLRWFLTNADQPQCRAIGRELILLHLDRLLGENGEDQLLKEDNNYKKLYCKTIPALCDIKNPDIEQIKRQWSILRRRLPKIDHFVTRKYLNKINKDLPEEERKKWLEKIEQVEVGNDLSAVTFGLDSYQYFDNEAKIKSINAYYLDQFFEELCAENKYDAEVGFWLHKLPDEAVKKDEPFISVFFRSSRTSEHELLSKVRHFLANEVAIA